MAQTIRCGVYFKSASRSVPVENFLRRVGVTRLDTSDGPQKNKQTFWFSSKAQFDKEMPGLVESITPFTVHHPIPVFQVVEEEVSEQPQGGSAVERESQPESEQETASEPPTQESSVTSDPLRKKVGRPRKQQAG